MKIAIIAGSGDFPIQIAKENPDAFVLCIEDHSTQSSFNNNSEIVCQGVLPSYPFALIFEEILGLIPGGTESIFAKEDLFTDEDFRALDDYDI